MSDLPLESFGPWFVSKKKKELVAEHRREAPPGHVLFGIPISTLAIRGDQDDVLFSLDDGSGRVASVHLTWSVETDPTVPYTEIFDDVQAWMVAERARSEEE